MKIYELTDNYLRVQELIEEGELDNDVLADTLEGIEGEIEEKADNYAKIMKNLQKDVDGIKAEEKRLADKRRAVENHVKSLKDNLTQAMLTMDKKKFKTDYFSFGIQKNAPSLIIDNEEEVDGEYLIVKTSIDKTAIKAAIKDGKAIGYAHLEQSESLRIR